MKVIGDVKTIGDSIMIHADNLLEQLEDGKYTVELKKYRKGRSLDQNAYFWKLVGEIAKKEDGDLRNKNTLYLHLLKESGAKYEVMYGQEEAIKSLIDCGIFRDAVIASRKVVNNVSVVSVYLFYGSSTFDTKEMSDLIDTTLRYASEVGVECVDEYWRELLKI